MKFIYLPIVCLALTAALPASGATATAGSPNEPRVIATAAPGFKVRACTAHGWCTVSLAGKRVLAIAESYTDQGASGLCMRGDRNDILHIAAELRVHPHGTRSGAVCIYNSATALPANPAVRADGSL